MAIPSIFSRAKSQKLARLFQYHLLMNPVSSCKINLCFLWAGINEHHYEIKVKSSWWRTCALCVSGNSVSWIFFFFVHVQCTSFIDCYQIKSHCWIMHILIPTASTISCLFLLFLLLLDIFFIYISYAISFLFPLQKPPITSMPHSLLNNQHTHISLS